jgi:hypothetical protein
VVQNQVDARAWHKHRQPPEKLDRVEHGVSLSVGPWLPELRPHLALVGQVDLLVGDDPARWDAGGGPTGTDSRSS